MGTGHYMNGTQSWITLKLCTSWRFDYKFYKMREKDHMVGITLGEDPKEQVWTLPFCPVGVSPISLIL